MITATSLYEFACKWQEQKAKEKRERRSRLAKMARERRKLQAELEKPSWVKVTA